LRSRNDKTTAGVFDTLSLESEHGFAANQVQQKAAHDTGSKFRWNASKEE